MAASCIESQYSAANKGFSRECFIRGAEAVEHPAYARKKEQEGFGAASQRPGEGQLSHI